MRAIDASTCKRIAENGAGAAMPPNQQLHNLVMISDGKI